MSNYFYSIFLLLFFGLSLIRTDSVKLQIPLKDKHESIFSFSLEMYDAQKYLECSGNIIVRKVNHQIVFTYKNFELHKRIGLNATEIHNAVALPIILRINHEGRMTLPDDYENWDKIDPRMIIKVLKYSDISINGQIEEQGWETYAENERWCKSESRVKHGKKNLHLHVYYNLENCLVNSDGVQLSYLEHFRVLDFYILANEHFITRYEYHYKMKTNVTDAQNSINIQFENFEQY